MPRRDTSTLVKALAGLLVLLAYGPFTPEASAACGDHVRTARDTAAPMPHERAPCTGPLCQQSKDLPTTPPAPAPDQNEGRDAALESPTPTTPALSSYVAGQAYLTLDGPARTIFHPPRA